MFGLSPTALLHWIYGLFIAALLGFGAIAWHEHNLTEQRIGKELVESAVSAEKTRNEQQNLKDNAARKAADDAQVAKDKADYESRLAVANASVDSLNSRLRKLSAASGSGKAALPGNPASVSGSNDSGGIPAGVEQSLEGVVVAAGHDAAKVAALQHYINGVCLKPQ